jgi:hypothetical protein
LEGRQNEDGRAKSIPKRFAKLEEFLNVLRPVAMMTDAPLGQSTINGKCH